MVPTCSRNFPLTVVWLSICTIRAREAWQRVACIPSRGGKGREAIPLVASSRGNREKLKISGQIGTSIKRFSHSLYAWLTLYWNYKWNWGTIHSWKWTIKESVLQQYIPLSPKLIDLSTIVSIFIQYARMTQPIIPPATISAGLWTPR